MTSHVASIALREGTWRSSVFPIQLQTQHKDIYMCVCVKGNKMNLKCIMVKGFVSLQMCLEGRLWKDTPLKGSNVLGCFSTVKSIPSFLIIKKNQAWNDPCIKKIRKQGHSTLYIPAGEGKLTSCHSLFIAQLLLFSIDLHINFK